MMNIFVIDILYFLQLQPIMSEVISHSQEPKSIRLQKSSLLSFIF